MSKCDKIRERLAEEGVEAAGLAEIARHLEGCADCGSFLESLRRVETALVDLPMPDATDVLATETLRAVRCAARGDGVDDGGSPARSGARDRWLAAGLAASVLLAAGIGLNAGRDGPYYKGPRFQSGSTFGMFDTVNYFSGGAEQEAVELGLDLARPDAGAPAADLPAVRRLGSGEFQYGREGSGIAGGSAATETGEKSGLERDIIALLDAEEGRQRTPGRAGPDRLEKGSEANLAVETPLAMSLAPPSGAKTKDAAELAEESDSFGFYAPPKNETAHRGRSAAVAGDDERPEAKLRSELAPSSDPDRSAAPVGGRSDDAGRPNQEMRDKSVVPADRRQTLAAAFLDRHRSLDGLSFQEPLGYWANTYIPGDPAMRLLDAQLRGWNRAAFGPRSGFEQEVRPVRQPFDAPRDAALAVYLHADAPAVDGPTRLRVQVGLKGADRQGGRRPAMNVGLVVDLREAMEPGAAARTRALVSALERARQPDDRFSLTVAGPGGGLVTPPEQFRHGPLRVAMEHMFGAGREETGQPAVSLTEALAMAVASARRGDDPAAVLGSSLVILVTGSSLAGDLEALETMAHRNAVAGLTLSVVGLAAGEDTGQIDRLVAAGQGNRRILNSAQAADGLVDRELHAASRAVARAVRLRIRLAPGVKLIDVLGSRRLAEPQVERVREAEQSIDRRLSRNLGIQADRGEDEEGIQIVIPTFHAGDDHVVLLDVVADRAGPIADVTVRYKDVIHLKNGVARASLSVGRGGGTVGPLELNVLKNLVAREYALRSQQASRYLAAGDQGNAYATITVLRDLIRGLQAEVPGWRTDPGLAADLALLNDYLAVLRSPALADAVQRSYVAASLRYAAFRKLQPEAR